MVEARLSVYAIIPVKKLDTGKQRLASILGKEERRVFSLCMLQDVLNTVSSTEGVDETVIVSPDKEVLETAEKAGLTPLKEEVQRGVNIAVKAANDFCIRRGASSTLVLPADIPLIQPRDIRRLMEALKTGDSVVITPSKRMDGTNALLRRPPKVIQTSYDKESYLTHIRYAEEKGVHLSIMRLRRVMLDLDIVEDVKEFLREESGTETYRCLSKIMQ